MRAMQQPLFERDLLRRPANFLPLTPLHFLKRSAEVFPSRLAIVDPLLESDLGFKSPLDAHGISLTYRQFYDRARRLASALTCAGIRRGDCVSVYSMNHGAVLEACFGVPMAGVVLNLVNFRLTSHEIAFALRFSQTKIVLAHVEYYSILEHALQQIDAYHRKVLGVCWMSACFIYSHEQGPKTETHCLISRSLSFW